jgi:polar amino acid transport system substrate-binding protein
MAALKEGTVAAVMAPRSDLEAGLGKDRQGFGISPLSARGLPVSEWDLRVAVKADNLELVTAVENAMSEMLNDGTIQNIFKKHGITYTPLRGK